MNPPIITSDYQRIKDEEHLKMLSIFHFVLAGLALIGLGFLLLHFLVMHAVFANPDIWKNQKNPPPRETMEMLRSFMGIFYVFFGLMISTVGVLNLFCALFLRQRKHRTFSFVVAGVNCLQIPFGTVLGVFTIVVLSRQSVADMFASSHSPPT
jgi:hypothetical protein